MIILDVNKLGINYGYGQLFNDISFSLNEGENISIVGPNGCGKSTLLKIIAGLEKQDTGIVSVKKDAKIAYLDQVGSSIIDNRNCIEILKDAFIELNRMQKRLNELLYKLKLEENNLNDKNLDGEKSKEAVKRYNEILQKYCNLNERFAFAGGYEIDLKINSIIEGLKIKKEVLNQKYNDLSGGEKTLMQLAKGLLLQPDLLLLDEPTNHLDIERIEWLEDYIKDFKGACIIVSHDRYFLDKLSNKILDIDDGIGKIYTTNYTGFLEQKQKEFEKNMSNYKAQQELLKKLEDEKKYFAERGMATNSTALTARAHVLQNKINRIKENALKKPKIHKKLKIDFDEIKKSSKRVVYIKDLKVEIQNRLVLDKINLDIFSGERVALLGANGSGKSTLLKTILGDSNLTFEGEVKLGPSVKIGYLPQIIVFPNPKQELLEYFMEEAKLNEQDSRRILAKFEFYKDDVIKLVEKLSGGEKMKIKLAVLLQKQVNMLIFDEPTNHIDIPTKEVLENAIDEFNGTLLFVSHDRYFINKFANRIIKIKNGKMHFGDTFKKQLF